MAAVRALVGDPAGVYGALAPHLESQIHDVCASASDVHAEWRTRPRPTKQQPAPN
ncbi:MULTISPECIES: hypothetical protein [Streptomyces]|uniref:Uncharacterized protein n=1 Tax=Streptomyces clavifer TaxID=68188 RepID=A0ABS4VIJ1_9ACTN|nr:MULTISPECIES: hypothetical protein [Streptomyces]MBP2363414.1 hypothetical protein [Streptomyces clavifer]MDX2748032.1 hypothetical protein [Streptomyces sp. NRRL_B-2557]GHB29941.1 hypothetical protein GCM10010392_67730 [Streptomyces clavifer]